MQWLVCKHDMIFIVVCDLMTLEYLMTVVCTTLAFRPRSGASRITFGLYNVAKEVSQSSQINDWRYGCLRHLEVTFRA